MIINATRKFLFSIVLSGTLSLQTKRMIITVIKEHFHNLRYGSEETDPQALTDLKWRHSYTGTNENLAQRFRSIPTLPVPVEKRRTYGTRENHWRKMTSFSKGSHLEPWVGASFHAHSSIISRKWSYSFEIDRHQSWKWCWWTPKWGRTHQQGLHLAWILEDAENTERTGNAAPNPKTEWKDGVHVSALVLDSPRKGRRTNKTVSDGRTKQLSPSSPLRSSNVSIRIQCGLAKRKRAQWWLVDGGTMDVVDVVDVVDLVRFG